MDAETEIDSEPRFFFTAPWEGQAPKSNSQMDNVELAIVQLYVPEYAGATIQCHFAMDHKDRVRMIKKGQTLTIRGKLSNQFDLLQDNLIHLNGCVIQE